MNRLDASQGVDQSPWARERCEHTTQRSRPKSLSSKKKTRILLCYGKITLTKIEYKTKELIYNVHNTRTEYLYLIKLPQ